MKIDDNALIMPEELVETRISAFVGGKPMAVTATTIFGLYKGDFGVIRYPNNLCSQMEVLDNNENGNYVFFDKDYNIVRANPKDFVMFNETPLYLYIAPNGHVSVEEILDLKKTFGRKDIKHVRDERVIEIKRALADKLKRLDDTNLCDYGAYVGGYDKTSGALSLSQRRGSSQKVKSSAMYLPTWSPDMDNCGYNIATSLESLINGATHVGSKRISTIKTPEDDPYTEYFRRKIPEITRGEMDKFLAKQEAQKYQM